jgi:hypothetical protein
LRISEVRVQFMRPFALLNLLAAYVLLSGRGRGVRHGNAPNAAILKFETAHIYCYQLKPPEGGGQA